MKPKFGICICGLNGSGKTTLARALAAKRDASSIEAWLTSLPCPVLRLDGIRNISDNVSEIVSLIHGQKGKLP